MTKYFKPDWHTINKVFANDDDRREIWKELNDLQKKLREKDNELYRLRAQQKKSDAINALKQLSNGCEVYYVGRAPEIPFGKQGIKSKDGRTRMTVNIDGKLWSIHYEHLSSEEPTQDQRRSRIVENRIVNLFNERK